MAKVEKLNVLLWYGKEGLGGGNLVDGRAYYYKDLDQLMTNLSIGRGYYCFETAEVKVGFLQALRDGQVKIATVGKNIQYSRESTPFSSTADGEMIVRNRVTYDSVSDEFFIMDSYKRANIKKWYGTYCKIEAIREPTPDEVETITDKLGNAESIFNVDKVFNLFAYLCCIKKVWQTYPKSMTDDKAWYDDKRERTFLGFQTFDLFTKDEVEARTKEVELVAHEAYKLTRALTGCELVVKGKEHLDFVSCLVSSRFLQNDDVNIRKGNPTITLKEVFERVVDNECRDDELDTAIKVCLSKMMLATNESKDHNRFIDDFLSANGLTVVGVNLWDYQHRAKIEDFGKVDKCVVLRNVDNNGAFFKVYMWDETATTYEMLDNDMGKFIDMVVLENK